MSSSLNYCNIRERNDGKKYNNIDEKAVFYTYEKKMLSFDNVINL